MGVGVGVRVRVGGLLNRGGGRESVERGEAKEQRERERETEH